MGNLTRSIATLSLVAFITGSAVAETAAPLPAGKPAGTKEAAFVAANFPLILVGLGLTVGIIAASGGFNTSKTNTTTTGTSS